MVVALKTVCFCDFLEYVIIIWSIVNRLSRDEIEIRPAFHSNWADNASEDIIVSKFRKKEELPPCCRWPTRASSTSTTTMLGRYTLLPGNESSVSSYRRRMLLSYVPDWYLEFSQVLTDVILTICRMITCILAYVHSALDLCLDCLLVAL